MRKTRFLWCVVLCLVTSVGCTSAAMLNLVHVLADVALAVASAEPEIAIIEQGVDAYFVAHPDAGAQAKVTEAIAKVRAGLATTAKTVHGMQSITQDDLDGALTDLRVAWAELQALLDQGGVAKAGRFTVALSARGPALTMPDPIVLHLKVKS